MKEAFWSVWLGLEERVGGQLPLGSHLFVEAMRYSVRMHNLFHVSKEQSTPLERLRGSTVQPVKSCEFGVVGFGKPQKDYPEHRGKRLVRAIYVGPHGANGSGIRVFVPLGDGKPPRLEIFSSFRVRDPVEFDKAVFDQLKGNREDPERPIKSSRLCLLRLPGRHVLASGESRAQTRLMKSGRFVSSSLLD